MRRSLIGLCLTVVAGCGGGTNTALRVVLELDPVIEIDQVRVQVVTAGSPLAMVDVPPRPGPAVRGGADVVLLFPAAAGGEVVEVYVAGLAAGEQVAMGTGSGSLRRDATVSVTVRLQAAACGVGGHACGNGCYPDDDVSHCGLACLACPEPAAHGYAVCAAGACGAECDPGFDRCGATCVDLEHDGDHCGTCERSCTAAQVCQQGACTANPCAADHHPCDGGCVSDFDVATCGSRCTPCPSAGNGTPTCDGASCGVACNSSFHLCGATCVSNSSTATCGTRCTPCPAPTNGFPTCITGVCGVTCDLTFHACGAECVDNGSVLHCGSSCTPCPVPQNGHATCNAEQCGVACDDGFAPCGNTCVPSGQPCAATWTQRVVSLAPSFRSASMAFDTDRGVAVLFGGFDGTNVFDDTWEWNGTQWNKAAPATKPAARSAHATVYDPIRKRTIVFGGADGSGVQLGDTWAWNGATWTQVATTGPSARFSAQATWSPSENVVLLFGGVGDIFVLAYADLWAWNGSAWQQRSPGGTLPVARSSGAMWFDPGRSEALLFGGSDGSTDLVDLFALSGDTWTQRTSASMVPRIEGGAVFHRAMGAGLFFGGADDDTAYGDTWKWDGSAWSVLSPANAPSGRAGFAITYDTWRDEMVVFGGAVPSGTGTWTYNSDTWVLGW